MDVMRSELPVVVIGAGPVGLAAAAHLAERNIPFIVVEAGGTAAAAMKQWDHVTFFSPWRFNIDGAARRLLEPTGWKQPESNRDPTGAELIDLYLKPLATLPQLSKSIRYDARVTAVTRQGMDRVPSKGRSNRPFEITLASRDDKSERIVARAVIDASGTWYSPNPAGANGRPAIGELENGDHITTRIPDVNGTDRAKYAGKDVVVIGSGHSAMDSILNLAILKRDAPETKISWVMRSAPTDKTFGGGTDDQLAERGALGTRAKQLITDEAVELVAPFRTARFESTSRGIKILSEENVSLIADKVIVATGFRPDFSMLSEIRLDLHPWLECARSIGELIDPNEHSCGDVPPHGVRELSQPEADFYIVGMKSYGRAPTFLMATGYEQVRSVVAALAGDLQAAHDTQLVLPTTGVCNGPGFKSEASCCGGPAPASANACCVADAVAKDQGQAGCGCQISGRCG